MSTKKQAGGEEVSNFMAKLEHPLKEEIQQLRKLILNVNSDLTETIKWNAPSFCFKGEDRITMRIHPPKNIQLIFHRGAKVQEIPKDKLIEDGSGILSWKTNDRAVATFANLEDIQAKKTDLAEIVNKWLTAAGTGAKQ